ncbi:hypothetical protein [Bradyrhizobium sp. ARR65]|uniref:hypothetical protein n=1 Tax=Bradyrhizobium sp. ARR65 TaxID=1040989 RepID=UPI0004634E57|nr:hypothetical protein [Bradyrhizobium sp. ARR65]
MGIDVAGLQFLCGAKAAGVVFEKTMLIGRQNIHIPEHLARRLFRRLGLPLSKYHFGQFAEPLLELLGALDIESIDASDYEGATVIHDMNAPISYTLHGRFSVVIDYGTLEHVFNFPQAIKNCMQMVQIGGHFVQVDGANNYMGHGFWQFSPELLFRTFSPDNGFTIKAVLLHVPDDRRPGKATFGQWYKVIDPDLAGTRVQMVNNRPTYICTIAQRTHVADIFARPPQQSDYAKTWSATLKQQSVRKNLIKRMIPASIKDRFRKVQFVCGPTYDPRFFTRVADQDLTSGRLFAS